MKLKLLIVALVLLLISGCNSSDAPDTEEPITKEPVAQKAGWYMRTVVKATNNGKVYVHKTAGVMGELKESKDGKDRHDISAFGAPVLSVVFVQTEWGEDSGDYFSDYRTYTGNENRQVWTIQVKNNTDKANLTHAALELTLDGPYTVYEEEQEGRTKYKEVLSKDTSKKDNIILVDVDNHKEYSYNELQNAQLSMDGLKTRTFRWVLGTTLEEDYEPLDVPSQSAQKVKNIETRTLKDPNDKFGIPPQF